MFKLLRIIDSLWFVVVPLVACGYLVFNENPHSNGIIWAGWLMFLLHMVATFSLVKSDQSNWAVIWSFLNSVALLFCLYYDIIDLEGFLILELVCEVASYSCAALFFVITNQKINGVPFWKKLGPGIAVMNLIILGGVIYPFIRVWLTHLSTSSDSLFYWSAGGFVLLSSVIKKTSVLKEVVAKVNSNKKSEGQETVKKTSKRTEVPAGVMVAFMISWFVVLLILKNIR